MGEIKTYTRKMHVWSMVAAMLLVSTASAATVVVETEVPAGAADMPTVVPSKQETADSVFAKLDNGKKGYISLADVTVLPGFDHVFQASDANHDGKLSLKEFKVAWPLYSGNSDPAMDAPGPK